MVRCGAIMAVLSGLCTPAGAGCRIALALGIDVSRSISGADYIIQRDGLLAALADPYIRAAFLKPADHITLAIFEWSGQDQQSLILDWTEVHTPADLNRVSAKIATHIRQPGNLPTGLGGALNYALDLVARAPTDCAARVLDVSGDGRNNDGPGPEKVYARQDFGDLVVNGLAIGEHEADLVPYYRTVLIRGPGAFVEVAAKQTDFPAAIRRKLMRELTAEVSRLTLLPASPEG
jgi:Protein of unknown function (DUF1194)